MARPESDTGRNLLFGVLALQNNFIGRDDLLGAFATWVASKARLLAEILVDRGALRNLGAPAGGAGGRAPQAARR